MKNFGISRLAHSHDFKGNLLAIVFLISVMGALLSRDTILFMVGNVVIILFLYFFFNKTLPPVVLMSAFFQWFFYHGKIFDGLLAGESVIAVDYYSATKPDIIMLGFFGTMVFFIGVYLTIRKIPILTFQEFRRFFDQIDLRRLFRIYILIYTTLFVAGRFIGFFQD